MTLDRREEDKSEFQIFQLKNCMIVYLDIHTIREDCSKSKVSTLKVVYSSARDHLV